MQPINPNRISSLDFLRGIVMILMVLDHSRIFMYNSQCSPENLECTMPLLFFTRWITHFCAPVFIFIVGISTYLYAEKKGRVATTKFLFTRGFFLIVLELTLFRFAWDSNFTRPVIELIVMWAIGTSMIFLGLAFRYLSYKMLFVIGLVIVFGHNLLDGIHPYPSSFLGKVWIILHQSVKFNLTETISIFVIYPVLPYFGLILLGFCFGKFFSIKLNIKQRRKYLLLIGIACILLFILLRIINYYGDPNPWIIQKNLLYSFLSFIKTTKYPISLMYILMTIGPSLLLLYLLDKKVLKIFSPIVIVGQVPMFFYILHLFVIKLITYIGGDMNTYSLAGVYIGWIVSIIILYIACRFYRIYKFNHPEKKWLSYI